MWRGLQSWGQRGPTWGTPGSGERRSSSCTLVPPVTTPRRAAPPPQARGSRARRRLPQSPRPEGAPRTPAQEKRRKRKERGGPSGPSSAATGAAVLGWSALGSGPRRARGCAAVPLPPCPGRGTHPARESSRPQPPAHVPAVRPVRPAAACAVRLRAVQTLWPRRAPLGPAPPGSAPPGPKTSPCQVGVLPVPRTPLSLGPF